MRRVEKVYAYITHGDQLLVFRHVDFPEAGIQVPGGTIESGEAPAVAVLREAIEETGLESLSLVSYLGSDEWHPVESVHDEIVHRYFYHLKCDQDVLQTWEHNERYPSDGSTEPILFEFYWLSISDAAESLPPYFRTKLDKLPDELLRHQLG
jgi:8-oxo-dGTP pyrophosphatase MutT (NUDIX family)